MFVFTSRLVLFLLLTVTAVEGGRRLIGERGRNYPVQKPSSLRLINLKRQLDLCLGKFLCSVRTVDNQCQVECIDKGDVCDGTINCYDGRDEMNCPATTTCPECQTCPEQTPCPSSECPAGEIRCGDGSACKAIQDICDGTDQCPPGDTVDQFILQCPIGNCLGGASPDICMENPGDFLVVDRLLIDVTTVTPSQPAKFLNSVEKISYHTGYTRESCRRLCNLKEECNGYVFEVGASEGTCFIFGQLSQLAVPDSCDSPSIRFQLFYCTS